MNTTLLRAVPLILAALLVPTFVHGGQVTVPNRFANGDVADAVQVNANFSALAAAINDNDTRLRLVEGTAVVRVPRVPGDDAASGEALRTALDSIPTSASIDSYAVVLEPGVYAVGSLALTIADGVVLRGAGRERTVVHSVAPTGFSLGSDANVEIHDLTLRCRPPQQGGRCIRAVSSELVLRHVRVDYLGIVGDGILSQGGRIEMSDTEVVVEATLSAGSPHGIDLVSADLEAWGCEITAIGNNTPRGMVVHGGVARLTNTTVRTIGPSGEGLVVGVNRDDVEIEAHGCRVFGFRSLRHAGTADSTLRVACSQLDGAIVGNATTVHCYDGSFAAIP